MVNENESQLATHCKICGRRLTDPLSRRLGVGKVCQHEYMRRGARRTAVKIVLEIAAAGELPQVFAHMEREAREQKEFDLWDREDDETTEEGETWATDDRQSSQRS